MSKISTTLFVFSTGLLVSACTILPQKPPLATVDTNQTEPTEVVMPTETALKNSSGSALPSGATKPLTLAEVTMHSTPTDCWMIVEGNVYDVTAFIAAQKHPGGEAILQGCGKEATELFTTRPMGSGTAHSDKATDMLQKFYLGELVTTTQPNSSDSGSILR